MSSAVEWAERLSRFGAGRLTLCEDGSLLSLAFTNEGRWFRGGCRAPVGNEVSGVRFQELRMENVGAPIVRPMPKIICAATGGGTPHLHPDT